MTDESVYDKFILSEHQILEDGPEPPEGTESVTKHVDPLSDFNSVERNRLIKLIVRHALHQAPFATKYDDIRNLIRQHMPQAYKMNVISAFIEEANKIINKLFGLTLCDIKYGQGKRDLFLKQSIAFPPHDLRILSEGDHELRGFLLVLIPCFKAYSNSISLNRLCEAFQKMGLQNKVPKNETEENELLTRLKSLKRRKGIKHSSKDFTNISDYLLYAKDLSYIIINYDIKGAGDKLSDVTITPGYRLKAELNKSTYIEMFKSIDEDSFNKGVNIFFEEK